MSYFKMPHYPYQCDPSQREASSPEHDILRRLDALEKRTETIGLELGMIAKILIDNSVPAQEMTHQQFSAELDQLLKEIFQGAQSLPFDQALRRAANLNGKKTDK